MKTINISKCVSITPVVRFLLPYSQSNDNIFLEEKVFFLMNKYLKDNQLSHVTEWGFDKDLIKVKMDTKKYSFIPQGDLLVYCVKRESYLVRDITNEIKLEPFPNV